MFYMRKSRRNELVVSIAILAIVALFVPRFSHVAYAIAKKVPRAKRVPIKKDSLVVLPTLILKFVCEHLLDNKPRGASPRRDYEDGIKYE